MSEHVPVSDVDMRFVRAYRKVWHAYRKVSGIEQAHYANKTDATEAAQAREAVTEAMQWMWFEMTKAEQEAS